MYNILIIYIILILTLWIIDNNICPEKKDIKENRFKIYYKNIIWIYISILSIKFIYLILYDMFKNIYIY